MLNKLLGLFKESVDLQKDVSGKPAGEDLQIAAAILFLETAGRDADYAPEEVREIFQAIEVMFGVPESSAMKILEAADRTRQEVKKIDQFVTLINQSFSEKQRMLLMAFIWKVVLADGKIEKDEERYTVQLKNRLRLSDEQADKARKLAFSGDI